MAISRRKLINTGAAAGAAAAAVGLSGPAGATTARRRGRGDDGHDGHDDHGRTHPLFPPLVDAGLLALPPGFTYTIVAQSGVTSLATGEKTPDRPDGTVALKTRGGYRLIQNHEISPNYGPTASPVPAVPGTVYDPGAVGGGCTVIDTDSAGRRRSEWVGLSGTVGNCAGGATPWGTWLSCEETDVKAGTVVGGFTLQKDHGYVFEVVPDEPSKQSPLPIEAWGRAAHEAVVIEPSRKRAYLTEDASSPTAGLPQPLTGLLYRWTAPRGYTLGPRIAEHLDKNAGTLEALAVIAPDGSVLPDLAYVTAAQIGRPFQTRWETVPDRHATTAPLRTQTYARPVTHSKKLEGAWGDERGMYFAASFAFGSNDLPVDATKHDGQIWYYRYSDATLTLQAYFPYDKERDARVAGGYGLDLAFDGPDNVHVSPYGSLVISEDGEAAQHLLSWSSASGAQAVARNLIPFDGGFSEMTGPCFSPDGKVLFGNVQEPGHVFAITGPWEKYLG